MKFYKNIRHIFFGVTALLLLVFAFTSLPTRHGDGHEYSLISQAFIHHLSVDVRKQDVNARIDQLAIYPSRGYILELFEKIRGCIETKSCNEHGLFLSKNGDFYGYHFWLYPVYVGLVEVIAVFFGLNPLSGFQVANVILIIAVIGFCMYGTRSNISRQFSMSMAFIMGGSLFYIKWTHPEVFIIAFIYIGMLFLFEKRALLSIPFFSIAATQVVTLWPLLIIVPLSLFYLNKNSFGRQIYLIKNNLWIILFLFLPASSLVFYYFNYGVISLIGSAHADLQLISISHLFSTWFDLNQGLIVGAPWVFVLMAIFVLSYKKLPSSVINPFYISLVASVVIALPLLAQTSVNSGQSVFQRYSLYAGVPLVAWCGYYFNYLIVKKLYVALLLLLSMVYIVYFDGANAKEDYLEHKPWVKLIFNSVPDFYNPEPGIFYARTSGRELRPEEKQASIYKDENGYIRKILYPVSSGEESVKFFCDGKLIDLNGLPIDWSHASWQAYGWGYQNGIFRCQGVELSKAIKIDARYEVALEKGIDFNRHGFPYFVEYIYGVGEFEPWGRWSIGDELVIKIKGLFTKKISLNINAVAFLGNSGKPISVDINGVAKNFVIDGNNDVQEHKILFEFPYPPSEILIRIKPPNPTSPKSMGISNDERLLGIGLKNLNFEQF